MSTTFIVSGVIGGDPGDVFVLGDQSYIVGETAFATINAAVNKAKTITDKVTIEIAEGEYTENVIFGARTFVENGVTYVGGITFKAVDGADVTVNGNFQCNGVAGDLKDIVFDGLTINNSAKNGGYYAPIMFGDNYTGKKASGIVVQNCTLNAETTLGTSIGVALTMGLVVEGVNVSNNTINAECAVYGGDGNPISNLVVSDNTMNGSQDMVNYTYWGIVYIYNSGNGNVISGNTIDNSAFKAIIVRKGEGIVVENNTITGCGEVNLSNGSVAAGNTFDGEALVFPVYSGDSLVVCGGIAGEAGDAVIINGEAYIVGTDVVGSFAEALANFDGNTSKIEIMGNITEAGPAASTTVALSRDLTISGGDVTWTSLGGWVWFKKAEDAGDVKLTFEGVKFNATNAKKAFYFGTDVVIDADSVVELYNGKIEENATVQVMAGGQINCYSEALNIDGKLKLTGNEDFNAAEAELADRQAFIQYSQNIYGEIELENSYFASYQRIDLKGTGSVTADNSLLVFGADKNGNWATNPVPNGYGDFNIYSADAELNLTNGSVLKATGDITNKGTIRIENSTFIANSTLASDGAVTADKQQSVLNNENGEIIVNGGNLSATTVENTEDGTLRVTGEGSVINVDTVTGNAVKLAGELVNSNIGGSVLVDGNGSIGGDNDEATEDVTTVTGMTKVVNGATLTVEAGAVLNTGKLAAGEDNYP